MSDAAPTTEKLPPIEEDTPDTIELAPPGNTIPLNTVNLLESTGDRAPQTRELRREAIVTENQLDDLVGGLFENDKEVEFFKELYAKSVEEGQGIPQAFLLEDFLEIKHKTKYRLKHSEDPSKEVLENIVHEKLDEAVQEYLNWEDSVSNNASTTVYTTTILNAAVLSNVTAGRPEIGKLIEELKYRGDALKASVAELGPDVVDAISTTDGNIKEVDWEEIAKYRPRRVWALDISLENVTEKAKGDEEYLEWLISEDGFDIQGTPEELADYAYVINRVREKIRGEAYSVCEELGNILRNSNEAKHVTAISSATNDVLLHRLKQFSDDTINKLGFAQRNGLKLDEAYKDFRLVVAPYEDQPVVLVKLGTGDGNTYVIGGLAADDTGILNLANNALKRNLSYEGTDKDLVKEYFLYISTREQEDSHRVTVKDKGTAFYLIRPLKIRSMQVKILIPDEKDRNNIYEPRKLRKLTVNQMRQLQKINIRFIDGKERERQFMAQALEEYRSNNNIGFEDKVVQTVETGEEDTVFLEADISGFSKLSEELSRIGLLTSKRIQGLVQEISSVYNHLGIAGDRFGGDAYAGIATQANALNRPDIVFDEKGRYAELKQLNPVIKTAIAQVAISEIINKQLIYTRELTHINAADSAEDEVQIVKLEDWLIENVTSIEQYEVTMNRFKKYLALEKNKRMQLMPNAHTAVLISEESQRKAFLTILHGMRLQGKEFGVRSYATHVGNMALNLQRIKGYGTGSQIKNTAVVESINLADHEEKLSKLAKVAVGSQAVIDKRTYELLKKRERELGLELSTLYSAHPDDEDIFLLDPTKINENQDINRFLATMGIERVTEDTSFAMDESIETNE